MTGTVVGLVVPPARGRVPPDAIAMYPQAQFLVEGIGVRDMTESGYAAAVDRLSAACDALAGRGAQAILLFGTSLSFFRGPAFNAELEATMSAASGLPSMTLTTAMVDALRLLGAARLAVATAYTPEVNAMFASYFGEEGFFIEAIEGLDLVSLADAEKAGSERIAELVRKVASDAANADAVVVSCAGLSTAGVCPALERELGIPVVSSAMIGAWAAMRIAGADARAAGFGRLYE